MHAPNFSLPDQNGKIHKLADYNGKWLIVYFYPKDNTSGCTKEACNFRDSFYEFKKNDVEIIGISKDSTASHKNFEQKYNLNFILLADTKTDVIKAFGAWGKKKMMGREYDGILRNTYLINPEGEIVQTYEKVDPATHVSQILKDIQRRICNNKLTT